MNIQNSLYPEGYELKTDEIRLEILKSINYKETFGYDIHKRLIDSGQKVEIGRIYKVLIDMLTEGVLSCRWEKSENGPKKRIYKLTTQGREELNEDLLKAINTIHSHYEQYLLNLKTTTNIFEGFERMVNPENKCLRNIALLAAHTNPMHEPLLSTFQNKSTGLEIFLIHPNLVDLSIGDRDFASMPGEYDNIPLREKYLDLLIVEGLPEAKVAVRAVEEWYRVLKSNGTLVVITPKALFSNLKDPLTIGDFIEKIEHLNVREGELVSGEVLQNLITDCFQRVQRREMLQMIVLVCHELGKPLLPR